MEIQLLQDIATIVTFIAPGYFTIQVYSLMHAKKEREFSRLVIESIIYSLPIVTLCSAVWHLFFGQAPQSIQTGYVALLIGVAILVGIVAGWLRMLWPIKQLARWLHIPEPNSDFLKNELGRINTTTPAASAVTVQLKSGSVFSGTVERVTRQTHDGSPMYFSFTNIAWFNETTSRWNERKGNIIVSRDEIEYIETSQLLDK